MVEDDHVYEDVPVSADYSLVTSKLNSGPGGLVASTKTSESLPGFNTRGTSSEQSVGLVWSFLRALAGSPRIL